jgi:hypothetical protein
MRFGARRIGRPADQRANPSADRRGSNVQWRPLADLVAVDDEGMDEHGSAEPRADAGPDCGAISRRVPRPFERPNRIERYGDSLRTRRLQGALVGESEVEIGIPDARQPSGNRRSIGGDDGDEIAWRQLASEVLEQCHTRLSDAR